MALSDEQLQARSDEAFAAEDYALAEGLSGILLKYGTANYDISQLHLISLFRVGKDGEALTFAGAVAEQQRNTSPWYATLLWLTSAAVSVEEVIHHTQHSPKRRCELMTYAGYALTIAGDRDGAVRCFRDAVACRIHCREAEMAQRELQRLTKPPAKRAAQRQNPFQVAEQFRHLRQGGRLDETAAAGELAVEGFRDLLGSDHLETAVLELELSETYWRLGMRHRTAALLAHASPILKKSPRTKKEDLYLELSLQLQFELHEPQRAIELATEALQFAKQISPSYAAVALNNLGAAYRKAKDYDAAERCVREGLRLRTAELGEAHPLVAGSEFSLAQVLWERGELEAAWEVSLRAYQTRAATKNPLVIDSGSQLASIAIARRDFQQAESTLLHTLARCTEPPFATDSPHHLLERVASSLNDVYEAQLDFDEAWKCALVAADAEERSFSRQLSGGARDDLLRAAIREQTQLRRLVAATLAAPTIDRVARAYETLLRRRALHAINAEALATLPSDEGRDGPTAPQAYGASRLDVWRSRLAMRFAGQHTIRASFQAVDDILASLEDVHEQEAAAAELQRARTKGLYVRRERLLALHDDMTCERVRSSLPARTILIEITETVVRDEMYYAAFVMASADLPIHARLVELGRSETLDTLAKKFSAILSSRSARGSGEYQTVGNALFEATLASVLASVRAEEIADQLLIAGTSYLCLLPFDTLPDADGRALIERYAVSSVSSGARLALQRARQRISPPHVVAAPSYDMDGGGQLPAARPALTVPVVVDEPGYADLAGAREEGRAIATLLDCPLIEGERATKLRVLGLASPWLLHIASHGYFKPFRPELLYLSPEAFARLTKQRVELRVGEEPFDLFDLLGDLSDTELRVGIVLAGVNTWLRTGRTDSECGNGVLTGYDVLSWDLSNTELVVLSACETGLGELVPGEVVGLRGAFQAAGVATVCCSTWRVPDEQTKKLMVNFYENLRAGMERARALREAKLHVRRDHPDPYYWGSFILDGNLGTLSL